ncbi:MAG: class I tRNA ligase family protein, partial [Nanoarchaeota archaeon]|nr:class I tRNA ligase family protein [Nanoarchaeota archaeon]
VDAFLKKVKSVSEKDAGDLEKEGAFTGSYAINPANNEKIPIYTGNFVLADYGSGMVMAVPAHDQRDFEFAKKYGIEIKQVVSGNITRTNAYTNEGKLINSDKFNDLDNQEAKEKITEWLSEKGIAKKTTNFKLRDWGISRQRYWGTPIPIIHCEKCGAVPVPEKDLPVEIPKDVKFGDGNPLETAKDWINVKCPRCGQDGKRETDTMDTFVNSSWYFMRYCDPNNNDKIFDTEKANYWCPIDTYIGGAEHACMHLIYVRFYTKFLRDLGLINFDEPAIKLFHQGMLHAEDGKKMSKSLGNVVDPLDTIKKYGVDATRFFLVSVASPDKNFDWSEKEVAGTLRFLKKIINLYENIKIGTDTKEVLSTLNQAIKETSKQFDSFDYRAATIKLRELFDLLAEQKEASKETLENALKILNPICPHITEELWEKLGNTDLISITQWPKTDESKIIKKGQVENLNEKTIEDIKYVLEKVENAKKIYLYVMPFELEKIDKKEIEEAIQKEIEIFAVNDPNKHDPEQKAKRAKPGKASIYLE